MNDFEQKIFLAVKEAVRQVYGIEPENSVLTVEVPRDHQLGDYATGAAMKLARVLHKSPMEIAQPLAEKLQELLPEAGRTSRATDGGGCMSSPISAAPTNRTCTG